jgi:hypothetical protein
MLALAKKEATAGPPLPFGPMVVGSASWDVPISEFIRGAKALMFRVKCSILTTFVRGNSCNVLGEVCVTRGHNILWPARAH